MNLNIIQALIQSDKNRKQTAFDMYYFYQNDVENIKPILKREAIKGELFTDATASMLPMNHRDITGKVLKNICTAYHWGVDRFLVDDNGDLDEDQTELLNDIYKRAGVIQAQKDWYRGGKLFNIVEVKCVWRKITNQLEFDIWTPNQFTVWENSENKYLKDVIIFDLVIPQPDGTELEVSEVWTKDQHYYTFLDGTGDTAQWKQMAFPRNPDKINPYKIIPSQELRFNQGEDYYGIGMNDLIDDNIWQDIRESNNVYVETLQGLGIVYAVNMGKQGSIPVTPSMMICINGVKAEDETPFIEAVATQAPLTELRDNLESNYQRILAQKGLSGQTGSTQNNNAPALSKALDLEELEIDIQGDRQILEEFEVKLFNIVRTVYNKETSETKLNEKLKFVINFKERKTVLSEQDRTTKWKFELEEGLKSKVDYLQDEDPDLTTEEAIKQLQENEKLKEQFKTELPAEPPPVSRNGAPVNQPA